MDRYKSNDLMSIEQEIDKIFVKLKQFEITNKRLHHKLQTKVKEIGRLHEERIVQIEGNIRNLGERIGKLEKQVKAILLFQFPDKE